MQVSTNLINFSSLVKNSSRDFILKTDKLLNQKAFLQKTLAFSLSIFAAIDLSYQRAIQDRLVTQAMQSCLDVLSLHTTWQSMIWWSHSKFDFDRKAFENSVNDYAERDELIQLFNQVFTSETFSNAEELKKIFSEKCEKKGLTNPGVVIREKERGTKEYLSNLSTICASIGNNLLVLDHWKVIRLPLGASSSQILAVFARSQLQIFVKGTFSFGCLMTIGYGTYEIYADIREGNSLSVEKVSGVIIPTLDLAAAAIPMLFAVNPAVSLSLGLISKGAGILSIWMKP